MINIPDSPALLNQMSFADAAVLDLNQERVLPYVRVRSDWNTVKNGDYCKVGDFFYFIENITMTSGDVAELTLVPDYVTSAGGPAALEILDGLTSRVHVIDDTYGLYGEDDPLMAPAYDMDVMIDVSSGSFADSGYYTFVETTLDLEAMGHYSGGHSGGVAPVRGKAIVAEEEPNGEFVTVPVAEYVPKGGRTLYSASLGQNMTWRNMPSPECQWLCYMDDTNYGQYIANGIAYARSLGVEESISGQYLIPQDMIISGGPVTNQGHVVSLTGKFGTPNCRNVPFEYGTANNKRVFYGSQTPYTLMTAAGNSLTAKAEEIYGGAAEPIVAWTCDPRRDGRPYFRFNPMNGVNSLIGGRQVDFFRNAVAGAKWREIPMVFSGKSGSLLDRIQTAASEKQRELGERQAKESFGQQSFTAGIGNVLNTAMASIAIAGGIAAAPATGGASLAMIAGGTSLASSNINYGMGQVSRAQSYQQYLEKSALDRSIEMTMLGVRIGASAPTIQFALDADLIADATGNGFVVTRDVYKQADIERIDKILTAYGYKHTKILETSDFTNRMYFNYVQAAVSVGNLPKWWADGIALQLNGGVRVWHVKPNHQYYNNNPVRT